MPTSRAQPDPLILCVTCSYDLTGINERGVCPECSAPIARSIAASHHPVAPPWLRLLAIAYFTSASVFLAGMYTMLFQPTSRASRWPFFGPLGERAEIGLVIVWVIGWALMLLCAERSRRLEISIGVSQFLLIVLVMFQPAVGR